MGIGPTYSAWKAAALPLCYTRTRLLTTPLWKTLLKITEKTSPQELDFSNFLVRVVSFRLQYSNQKHCESQDIFCFLNLRRVRRVKKY